APATGADAPRFTLLTRRAIVPDDQELAENPRSRSARLRVAQRTAAPAGPGDPDAPGIPTLHRKGRR
ncbi:MAG: 16S rRNA (cytosine(1402)-N(4))-methyltransferase, partial [Rhodobacter sp.]